LLILCVKKAVLDRGKKKFSVSRGQIKVYKSLRSVREDRDWTVAERRKQIEVKKVYLIYFVARQFVSDF
jgi:hypothetical protein